MPFSSELYPDKFVSVGGNPNLHSIQNKTPPSYNGDLNKFAMQNPNSDSNYKVHEELPGGGYRTLNQTLVAQYTLAQSKNHEDLNFALRNRHTTPNHAEAWDLIAPEKQINYPNARRKVHFKT